MRHTWVPMHEMREERKNHVRKSEGPRWLGKNLNHRLRALGTARQGEKSGPDWRGPSQVLEVFGLCAVPSGTEVVEPLQLLNRCRL